MKQNCIFLAAICLLSFHVHSQCEEASTNSIRIEFPRWNMGWLLIGEADRFEGDQLPAGGTVDIPPGKVIALRLNSPEMTPRWLNPEIKWKIEFLRTFPPDVVNDLLLFGIEKPDDLKSISHLTSIENLCLIGPEVTDAAFEHVLPLTNLTSLTLSVTNIGDRSVALLDHFPKLEYLGMVPQQKTGPYFPPFTHESLLVLAELHELRMLDLTGALIGNAGVKHLLEIPRLEMLWLQDTLITDDCISDLGKMQNLKYLGVRSTRVSLEGVQRLQQLLPKCEIDEFSKYGFREPSPPRRVVEFPPISVGTLDDVKQEGTVETMVCGRGYRPPAIQCRQKVLIAPWEHKGIELARDVQSLAFLQKLKPGDIHGLWIDQFSQLANVDRELQYITHLNGMQEIQIDSPQLSGTGLGHLKGLTTLLRLRLRGTRIDDNSLIHLQAIASLIDLNISDTAITDKGALYISKLHSIKSLNISETKITDRGLAHLASLKNLRDLHVGTNISDKAIATLKASLPQCGINRYASVPVATPTPPPAAPVS